MADPSEATIQGQINNVVDVFVAMRGWGGADSPNLVGMVDTIEQAIEGDYADGIAGACRSVRGTFGGMLAQLRGIIDPMWQTYGKQRDFPETDVFSILSRLYDDFITNSKSVNSREFTFGTVSAGGSNVGDGTILRLTKDKNDLDMEAVTPDVKTFKCISDRHSNATQHEETLEVRGQHADRDGIIVTGSGQIGQAKAASAADSARYLQNPSFDVLDGTVGSLTSVPGWVVGTIGNFDLSTTIYRDWSGAPKTAATATAAQSTTGYSLKVSANDTIEQNLSTRNYRNPVINGTLAPMCLQVAWNRSVGSSDACTITLALGSQTKVVNVGGAESGWQIARLGPGDENWYDTWNEEDASISINVAGLSSGYLLFDDLIFTPFIPFDGCWWLPVGGATPFLREDSFTFTDTIASDTKVQRMLAELYGYYLPHNGAGGETWSDPT